jgi:hypothetical protein
MVGTQDSDREVAWGRGLLAGVGAGLVAALASVIVRGLFHAILPPLVPTIGSAFVSGLGGGVLYVLLSRVWARPTTPFVIVILALATLDSIFIAALPMPGGPLPRPLFPIVGLVVPIRQLAALLGLGQFGVRSFPREYLLAVTVIHYATAAAVAWLVPWWAGAGQKSRSG